MYSIRNGPLLRLTASKIDIQRLEFNLTQGISMTKPWFAKHYESISESKAKMKDRGNIDCFCILCRRSNIVNNFFFHLYNFLWIYEAV